MKIQEKIAENLKDEGAAEVGFAFIGNSFETDRRLQFAVSILYKLNESIMGGIFQAAAPTKQYYSHYRIVNTKLDLLALTASQILENNNFKAYPIAASQTIASEEDSYRGLFSHKFAAVKAGLGFIGKNAMLVSEKYGSLVRLVSVLTDCPFACGQEILPLCGACLACVQRCPAQALSGQNYAYSAPRSSVMDAGKCSEYMKKAYKDIGRGSVCNLCACKKYPLDKF